MVHERIGVWTWSPASSERSTADADQLSQVWMNVLGNAIKFTPAGGHTYIKLVPTPRPGSIRIQDNGIGILHR